MITYGQHYDFAQGWIKTQGGTSVLTSEGLAVAVGLMALMTAVNFLSIKKLANCEQRHHVVEGRRALADHIRAGSGLSFQTSNFTAADGFNPYGAKGILSAVSTSGIIFALLGFEQADQLAGESSNPKRDIPRAVIGSVVIGIFIYVALQIVFLAALTPSKIGNTWSKGGFLDFTGPFAQVATLASVG